MDAAPTAARLESAGPLPELRRSGIGALVGTLGIACLPTLGALGYPSALLASPLYALFGVRLGLRQMPRGVALRGHALRTLSLQAARRCALVWALGLALLVASGLLQGQLDLWFGVACFALAPLLSTLMGWACGLVAGALSQRRLVRSVLAFGPFVACLALSLLRLYRDPALFAFDPFWGTLSGGIYDQDFLIEGRYLAYRGYNLALWAAVLALFARTWDPRAGGIDLRRLPQRPFVSGAALAVLAAGLTVASRPARFGFHQDAQQLARLLGARRESAHFVLHFRPDSANAREIEAIADELELWWQLLSEQLSAAPRAPVTVFLFDSTEDKRALLGVGAAEVAAPWRRELYLHHRPDPHPVLPHELAHVFGAPFGDALFGLALDLPRVNAGLIEGFAEALAGRPHEHLDVHDRAAILARLELVPPLATLFGWGFWAAAPARAYDAAGSFCRWILEREGAPALEELYRSGGDFERVLGRPLAALETEWQRFLALRPVDEEDVARQRLRFERGSLFERPHAYPVARLQRRVERALRAGELERALRLQARVATLEPESPAHRMESVRLLAAAGRRDEARAVLRPSLEDATLPALLRGALAQLAGDLAFADGALDEARALYEAALASPSSAAARRLLLLKRHACLDAARAQAWSRYLALFELEPDGDLLARRRLAAALALGELSGERALGSYLAALQHAQVYELAEARTLLMAALQAPSWSLPAFEPAARQLLLRVSTRLGDYERATELLASLRAEERGAGDRARNELWNRRIAFLRARAH